MRSDFRCFTTITRLINHSLDQSRDQSIDRSTTRSINHSTDQSTDQSITRSINQPINQSITLDQSIDQSIDHQSITRSITRDRSINQTKHVMFYNSFTCRYGCFVRIEFLIFVSKIWRRFYGPCGYNTYSYAHVRIKYELLRIERIDAQRPSHPYMLV